MKKIATTRKSNRRPARERKHPSGVQNQLSKRCSTAASTKSKDTLMDTTLEQPITEATETATVEAPENHKAEFTRGQLGKAKRAFAKAGQPEASEEIRKKWLAEMRAANIAVMDFASSRLAKVIKGELTVSELQRSRPGNCDNALA
jgi:uncharacterized protein (DUF885 family)